MPRTARLALLAALALTVTPLAADPPKQTLCPIMTTDEVDPEHSAVVEYKEYAGRTHRLVSQDGWEEIADYALQWATEHQVAQPATEAAK